MQSVDHFNKFATQSHNSTKTMIAKQLALQMFGFKERRNQHTNNPACRRGWARRAGSSWNAISIATDQSFQAIV